MFDFPVSIKDLAEIPERFRTLYEATDDGFLLQEVLASRIAPADWAEVTDRLQSEKVSLTKQLAEKEQALSDLVARHNRSFIDQTIDQAVEMAGGSKQLLRPHIRSQVRIIEQEGERLLEVIDSNGKPRQTQDGHLFDLEMLLTELKASDVFAPAFQNSTMSGGGMKPVGSDQGSGSISRQDQSAVNANIKEIAAGTVSVS